MRESVGFIGLGVMGRPMAGHLLAKGYPVVVHNRSRGAMDELVSSGATATKTPAEAAARSTVVILMLPDTPDVEAVMTAPDGVLQSLRPGSLVIDMSSISPAATAHLAALVASRGGTMLDAPVSGGEIGAIDGTLSIMVGGDASAFARARPLLECMGRPDRITHVGSEPGSGQVCKVCNQVAIGGALLGVREAFALARSAGVDPARVREALLGGFAASRVLEVHGERLLEGNFAPGFRTTLYRKDLRIARETAAAGSLAIPCTQVVTALVERLIEEGSGDLDYSAIGQVEAGGALVGR